MLLQKFFSPLDSAEKAGVIRKNLYNALPGLELIGWSFIAHLPCAGRAGVNFAEEVPSLLARQVAL